MDYVIFHPHPLLKPFIRNGWIVTGESSEVQKVVCDGHSELIFHFGDTYKIQKNGAWQRQALSLVAGQIDEPIAIQPSGRSGIIGLKFTVTGLWHLFQWNMHAITNEVLSLEEFFPAPLISTLQEQILAAPHHRNRIQVIEDFLLPRLVLATHKPRLDPVIDYITKKDGVISVSTLASDFKLSMRKLERMFNEQVGVPPKVFARMVRFKKVYELLQHRHLNTAEVSQLCDYFDQSHLNKDFKQFSGEDPHNYFSGNHAFAKFLMT